MLHVPHVASGVIDLVLRDGLVSSAGVNQRPETVDLTGVVLRVKFDSIVQNCICYVAPSSLITMSVVSW